MLQILESHAIQELIRAVSEFFRHQASAKKRESNYCHDKRRRRQHRKGQRRQGPRENERYEDGDCYEDGRDTSDQGCRGMSGYHCGPA